MAQYKFGTGNLYAIGTAANATPIQFGALQDVSIDVQFSNKELYGQNIFALAVGRAQGKVSGKAKFAQVNGLLYNSIFFNLLERMKNNTCHSAFMIFIRTIHIEEF